MNSALSSAVVTVTCTHGGHDPATATFAAVAAGGCDDPLGTLGVGSVTRSGTIAADAACVSPQRVRDGGDAKRYWARRHTFTLAAPMKVTVDAGSPTRRGLDAYAVLLEGHSSDGTGAVAGRDNNSGPRRDARLAALALPAGDYTVEVTTAGKRRTGNYRLQVTATAVSAACTDDLGTLAAGRYTRTGTITDTCVSTRRGTPTARPGARWHTFTLAAPAWVDIDLAAAAASPLDPYLLLIGTDNGTPAIIEQDDNSGTGNTAQIQGRYLQAGTYTIETTAAAATGTTADGDYTLTVTIPIHGLAQTINATVDEQTTINFTYWPTNASLGLASRTENLAELAESQGVFVVAGGGKGVAYASPQLADRHLLSVGHSVPTASVSGQSSSSRSTTRGVSGSAAPTPPPREFAVEVQVGCASGHPLSQVNSRLCRTPPSGSPTPPQRTDLDDGALYRVTEGALAGTRWAATTAKDKYYVDTGSQCRSVSVNHLIALMLSISYWEVPVLDKDGVNRRWFARSPMALSRKDYQGQRVQEGHDNAHLYAGGHWKRAPRRAYWTPGVGLWQLDDTFDASIKFGEKDENVLALNHAERANTYVGGRYVAYELLQKLCPSGVTDNSINKAFGRWLACKVEQKDGSFTRPCRDKSYDSIFDPDTDELYVTTDDYSMSNIGPDVGYGYATSTSGGLISTECRWGQSGLPFGCHLYDVSNREGEMEVFNPGGIVIPDLPAVPDEELSNSPLAARFISFTDDALERRFVVFPKSSLADSSSTWIRGVPTDENARLPGNGWQQTRYAADGQRPGLELHVKVCGTQKHRPFDYRCTEPWPSVNSDRFLVAIDTLRWTGRTREFPNNPQPLPDEQ